MDKLAQKRHPVDTYIREPLNFGGELIEKFFNPEFKDVMDELRDNTDDPVRKLMLGEEGNDKMPLKEVLKLAKSNFNKREYLKSIDFICRFHNRMIPVVELLTKFSDNLDKAHQQFLTKGLDPEELQYLQKHKKAFMKSKQDEFIKSAGLMPDFLLDIKDFVMGEERPRALRAWEKRYPGKLKNLKRDTVRLLDASEKLFNTSVLALKGMSRARAQRKVDDYTSDAIKIIKGFADYNTKFEEFKTAHDKDVFNNPMLLENKSKEKAPVIDTEDMGLRVKLDKIEEKSRKLKELQKKYKPGSEEYDLIEEKLEKYKQEYLDLKKEKKVSIKEDKFVEPELDIPEPKPAAEAYMRDDAITNVLPARLPTVAPPSLPQDDEALTTPIIEPVTTPIPSKAPKTLRDFGKGSQPEQVDIKAPNFDEDKEFKPKFNAPLTPAQQKVRLITQQIDDSLKEKENKKLDKEIAQVNAHQEFYIHLESLSSQEPTVLKSYISKYAKLIQFSDPKTAIYLFNISKSI